MRLLRTAIGLAALLAGATASAEPAAPIPAEARAAIERANGEWAEAIKAGNADRLAAPYADDGVFVAADGTTVSGRQAIRDFFAGGNRSAKVTDAELKSDGWVLAAEGLVYEWGHGQLSARAQDGRAVTRQAGYLTVWKRVASGEWRILRNMSL